MRQLHIHMLARRVPVGCLTDGDLMVLLRLRRIRSTAGDAAAAQTDCWEIVYAMQCLPVSPGDDVVTPTQGHLLAAALQVAKDLRPKWLTMC